MKNSISAIAAFGLMAGFLSVAGSDLSHAGDREYSTKNTQERSGNWSRAQTSNPSKETTGKKGTKKSASTSPDVPLPRAKPGSKAAKTQAAAVKAKEVEAEKTETKQEASAPTPRKKEAPKKAVQAGLAPPAGDAGNSSAPYRGSLDGPEVKEILSGKVVESRIDGKDARITLSDDGTLAWTTSAGEGQGRWWTEKGRVCDRYDPAGSFPGRGTGCRSFEQKADGYYAGGRKLKFLN